MTEICNKNAAECRHIIIASIAKFIYEMQEALHQPLRNRIPCSDAAARGVSQFVDSSIAAPPSRDRFRLDTF